MLIPIHPELSAGPRWLLRNQVANYLTWLTTLAALLPFLLQRFRTKGIHKIYIWRLYLAKSFPLRFDYSFSIPTSWKGSINYCQLTHGRAIYGVVVPTSALPLPFRIDWDLLIKHLNPSWAAWIPKFSLFVRQKNCLQEELHPLESILRLPIPYVVRYAVAG